MAGNGRHVVDGRSGGEDKGGVGRWGGLGAEERGARAGVEGSKEWLGENSSIFESLLTLMHIAK